MVFIAIDLDDTPFDPVTDNSNLLHHIWTCSKSSDIINYKEKILSITDSIKTEFANIENSIKDFLYYECDIINEQDKDFSNNLLKTNINIIDDENLFFNVGFNDTFKLHFIPKVEIDFSTTNEALLTFLDLCQIFPVATGETGETGITYSDFIKECASNIHSLIGKLNMCFYILGVTVANKLIN